MTQSNDIIVGGVYKTIYDERPHRVIGIDKIELFYDSWWEHTNNWGLKSHNGKVFFYRASLKRFKEISELIQVDPLDDVEINKYKLDLPFRICRHAEIGWTNTFYKNIGEFSESIKETNFELHNLETLKAKEIKLYPFGSKGGHKKSVVVNPDNGDFFTEIELLWKAQNIQSLYIKEVKKGVGLFRLGIEKGMASYYIGNFHDNAETTKDAA
ncbi:MAG: hypothetical protein KF862_01120 [Chitinophagaceae bacterium]|nr:hypothetical protein [Chitinophagaceae bacterium]